MSDWLSKIHFEQAELAKEIAGVIIKKDELLCIVKLSSFLADKGFDPESFWDLTISELNIDVLHAIRGYTDWVASKIILSGNFGPQPLPRYQDVGLQTISKNENYRVEVELLKLVIKKLHNKRLHFEYTLPMLGKIDIHGMLTPDEETLKKWAALFNWTTPRTTK